MIHKSPNTKPNVYHRSQFVLLSPEGKILASDDTLLKLQELKGSLITEHIPFIECVFPEVISKIKNALNIYYSAINLTDPNLVVDISKRFYDFNFFPRTKDIIVWEIMDLSHYYETLRDTQHYYQERELRLQYLQQKLAQHNFEY